VAILFKSFSEKQIITLLRITPVFLGGIVAGSGTYASCLVVFISLKAVAGNKPPWTNPAKASYGSYDNARAKKYFKTPNLKVPPFFPIVSLLVSFRLPLV
jgi:hypothetical protein